MPPSRRRRRSTPTPAQIWRILNAAAKEARIAKRERQALLRRLEREAAAQKKALEREAAARKQELERELVARKKELAERDAALAEKHRLAEEARRKAQAERDARLDERLHKIAGDGDNRWGRLMEALVEGNLLKLLRDAGVPVARVFPRVRSSREEEWREYDLVAVGTSDAVVVEVKTTLRYADVQRFTERLRGFREWRPDHARPRLQGALAYLTAHGEAARAGEAAGFYLIRAVAGTAKLANTEGFTPRLF